MTEGKDKPLIFVVLDAPADRFALPTPDPTDKKARTISPSAVKTVLLALVGHFNAKRNGSLVWPSIPRLVELTGLGKNTVRWALHGMHKIDLIKIRTDCGRSNAYSLNLDCIRALTDPSHGGRGLERDPSHGGTGTPPMVGRDPSHGGTRTAKEQPRENSQPDLYPVGHSLNLKVSDGDHQRKLAMLGVVAETSERMRIPHREQPTEEKQREVARQLTADALAAKAGAG